MKKVLTIGELHKIYQKYGDLGFKVETPYGFKDIEWCGITEENADIYRCELENGMYVEGADYHKLKHENDEFIHLKEAEVGVPIQTIDGISKIKTIELMDFKDTLYDIQVAEVHQYYTNGIVSHNTTLTVDSIKYLLFGKTTKTDKNEEVFNLHSDNNELVVRGMIEIEGDDEIIIERNMKRTKNKSGGWTIRNVVNYYKILPDGEEELLNDEDAIKTTKKIRNTIGTEKDFELVVLATARNLDDLIDFTSGESGKLLTRFIGLDIIETKEDIARGMYNTFSKTMKSNLYDVITLSDEIETHNENIIKLKDIEIALNVKLDTEKQSIIDLTNNKLNLVSDKIKVDVEILTLNPSKLEKDISTMIETGTNYKKDVDDIDVRIKEIGKLVFDEDRHFEITNEVNILNTSVAVKNAEIERLKTVIDDLIAGGICKACNRKLDDVDNSKHIEEHNTTIKTIEDEVSKINKKLIKLNKELVNLDETKKLVDEVNKLELNKDKIEVEISSLKNNLKIKKTDLKKYNENLNAIETNKTIDADISLIDTKLSVCDHQKTEINNKLQRVILDVETNTKDIETKTKLIEQIKKEKEVETIYKLYIDMIGKKGISKLVLRSVLPIINSELQRLLDDVTDFEVEISIDDKNEVRYLLIKDDIEKSLKAGSGFERTASSLALRCVLGKMSKLSMPNFITFDEVLGRVAPNNVEKMKLLFDKIKDMYDNIFFITQNEVVKDWSDNIVTVIKENNISKINVN
jgi:DNA repair exonuclease SbcCD ATPase subunit